MLLFRETLEAQGLKQRRSRTAVKKYWAHHSNEESNKRELTEIKKKWHKVT
jgi:hypothetical protein